MGTDRHLFPGGNTPLGFFSYYPYILPQDRAHHIFCVKGGPGVGKSTFIKKIAKAAGERGIAAEHMHCSSDPGSLDGLVFPELRTALIDGTAPHVVDPKNPGAVDEIINLGEYWDLPGIKQHRDDIMRDNAMVGLLFARVYRLLGAARRIQEDIEAILARHTDATGAYVEMEPALDLLTGHRKGRHIGYERKLFASAITPDGLINHLDTLAPGYQRVVRLKGAGGLSSAFLSQFAQEATRRALDVEEFFCPMDPAVKLEHLLIPELSVAFLTESRYHEAPAYCTETIDFSKYVRTPDADEAHELDYDEKAFDGLLDEAVATLHRAKALHDHMETFYIPNMDFEAIARKREEIAARILGG